MAEFAILVFATLIAAERATARALVLLRRRQVLDRPNERSSHVEPTPRGGGIGVLAALVPALAVVLVASDAGPPWWLLLLGTVLLAAIGFRDDLRGLPAGLRFAAQALAVGSVLALLPGELRLVSWLPIPLERLLLGLAWLWFVNLFNFMDGIDGISGVEAVAIGLGTALVALAAGIAGLAAPGLVVAAAAAGFLVWNWHPARLFLGDVGSVPLGYVLGFLLLMLALHGQWPAALLLALYHWADATLTLLRRLMRGEKVWRAHRQHFYQRAVRGGMSHARVARIVAALDAGLVLLAVKCVWVPLLMPVNLLIGASLTALVLWRFGRGSPP